MIGEYDLVEFKHSKSAKPDTISHLLMDGFKQSNNVALKLTKMSLGEFIEAIEDLRRNRHRIGNIKLINRNGKVKDIHWYDLYDGSYKRKLKGSY